MAWGARTGEHSHAGQSPVVKCSVRAEGLAEWWQWAQWIHCLYRRYSPALFWWELLPLLQRLTITGWIMRVISPQYDE